MYVYLGVKFMMFNLKFIVKNRALGPPELLFWPFAFEKNDRLLTGGVVFFFTGKNVFFGGLRCRGCSAWRGVAWRGVW